MTDQALNTLLTNYPKLDAQGAQIEAAIGMLCNCFEAGNKLLICGNGGSAADSDHIAGELLKGFALPRPLTTQQREQLPEPLADKLQRALPVIPLSGFPAFSSAFTNDCDSAYSYAQLVWALGKPGDVLLAISTSGNSSNVLNAVETAKAKSMHCIALSGRGGGALLEHCSPNIVVPETETFRIQEYHLPIYHCLCLAIENHFFGTSEGSPITAPEI